MPLLPFLAAPGSPCRFLGRKTRLPLLDSLHRTVPIAVLGLSHSLSICQIHHIAHLGKPSVLPLDHTRKTHDSIERRSARYSTVPQLQHSSDELLEGEVDLAASILNVDKNHNDVDLSVPASSHPHMCYGSYVLHSRSRNPRRFQRPPISANPPHRRILPRLPHLPRLTRLRPPRYALKAKRGSQPTLILESIQNENRDLYDTSYFKKDLSYSAPTKWKAGGIPRPSRKALAPGGNSELRVSNLSLYTILSRHIRSLTAVPGADPTLNLHPQETSLLESQGYTAKNIELWASCILNPKSAVAVRLFRNEHQIPPFFLVLLFLRRKYVRAFTLGIIMRHINARQRREHMSWTTLTLLVTRLVRHARVLWPESIPWIASFFTTEAMRIYRKSTMQGGSFNKLLSDMTRFSNKFLSLLSLPASIRPVLSSIHQEKAQFEVLQFMDSCNPPLVVTRNGFRAITRNQLMRSKTSQEREWATLKGPSWPPWKENRTAMDEDKSYDFGSSRASRILGRMYEAGYEGNTWDAIAGLYAGWDTDTSPTIQSRTTLPRFSTQYSASNSLKSHLWAARIRTTRTRREAWAAYLACEASNAPMSSDIFFAMFEKLHFPEITMKGPRQGVPQKKPLLPGDMKEVLPDPKSPLHLVHLSEPVPTSEQLFHRMVSKGVRPTGKFLGFLLETLPNFSVVMELLESTQGNFNGGIGRLFQGRLVEESTSSVPARFLGSLMQFLCRFGRFSQIPSTKPMAVSPDDHLSRFKSDDQYLLDYAYALLMHFRPGYRPAWTEYMQKVLFSDFGPNTTEHDKATQIVTQYTIICHLLEVMGEVDIDPDDEQFRLLCAATRYAVQAARKGELSVQDTKLVLSTAPRRLRTVFHGLVAANVDPDNPIPEKDECTIPPHIPDPAALHAYVRALGILRDYEGLYSFATWATANHAEITARANAQYSGSQALYRTLVAIRAGLEGKLDHRHEGAPKDLVELAKAQLESVEPWGWPPDEHVNLYSMNRLREANTPTLAGSS